VFIGKDTVAVPIVFGMLFTFGTAGLLVSSVSILRDRSQAFIAGAVLLGTPFYISLGSAQYADVPLSFFLLATLVTMTLGARTCEFSLFLLAGLFAGFSGWVKNEGLLVLLSAVFALVVRAALSNDRASDLKQIGWFFLGMVPVLLMVTIFKAQFSPGNEVVSESNLATIGSKLTDLGRHLTSLYAFQGGIRTFGGWLISLPIILFFYLLAFGLHANLNFKNELVFSLTFLTLILSGYYLVYIITPADLRWHLGTSLHRLLIHLWPSILFVYFLIVRSPEEALDQVRVTARAV
jgi:hypothetical protein